jgi:hypothetical protein
MDSETMAEGPAGLPWLSPGGGFSPAAREVEHHFHWARQNGLEVGVIWLEIVGVGPARPWWVMVPKTNPPEDCRWNIEATLSVEVGDSKYEDTGTYEVPLDSG